MIIQIARMITDPNPKKEMNLSDVNDVMKNIGEMINKQVVLIKF